MLRQRPSYCLPLAVLVLLLVGTLAHGEQTWTSTPPALQPPVTKNLPRKPAQIVSDLEQSLTAHAREATDLSMDLRKLSESLAKTSEMLKDSQIEASAWRQDFERMSHLYASLESSSRKAEEAAAEKIKAESMRANRAEAQRNALGVVSSVLGLLAIIAAVL